MTNYNEDFIKHTDVFGRASGVEALEQWGKEGADAQLEDMQAGRYEPFHTKSLRETYNEDILIAALDWTREKAIENSALLYNWCRRYCTWSWIGSLGFAPAAAIAGLATVAGTIFQGTGEVALEMEEKTGDYNDNTAFSWRRYISRYFRQNLAQVR